MNEATEKNWQGIVSPEPPTARHHHRAILRQATAMLASRKKNLPFLVHKGEMNAVDASHQIALFSFIVDDWQWIVSGDGARASDINLQDRKATLDKSIATIADIVRDRGGFDDQLERQADLVIAMRWHLERRRDRRDVYWLAELNHELRRQSNYRILNGTNAIEPINMEGENNEKRAA